MSRPLSELLPDVILSAPGCPPMVALQALSGATREFLTKTSAWKPWAAEVRDATADTPTVAWANHLSDPVSPDPLQGQYITLRVDALQWAPTGDEIEYATHAQLQEKDPEWRTRTGPVVKYWTQDPDDGDALGSIRLVPVPSVTVAAALRARLVIITHSYAGIGANATDALAVALPDHLFHRYRDTLIDGALARLFRMPGRDWTDKSLAEYHRSLYENALFPAKSEADNDFTDSVTTVLYGGY